MLIHSNFQISPFRNKKYDVLLRTPVLERSEAESVLCYYLLRNIDAFCYFVLGCEMLPFQSIILRTLIRKPFPMLILSRGGSKTWSLGIYSVIRACITSGSKVVMVGSSRRQSRFIFEEAKKVYYNPKASLFRELVPKPPTDLPEASTMIVRGTDKQSLIAAYPLGAGEKIRGIRSSHLIVDEFNVVPNDIFNTVLKPTSAVSINPVDKVKRIKREKELIDAGIISSDDATEFDDNQIIISSSASYQFTFMYQLYKEYKKIILEGAESHDKKVIKNASKYCIIQLGCDSITKVAPGYLDESNLENARSMLPSDRFDTEYGAQFVSDSGGFIKRSLIDSRSLKINEAPIVEISAQSGYVYILSADPSSGENEKNDFFGIVVIKLDMTTRTSYIVNASASSGKGWPYYVALVKEYMNNFNPVYIISDAFGGGSQMASLLCSPDFANKEKGERPLVSIDKDDIKTYCHASNRILRMNTPTNQFNEASNTHLKSLLEHKKIWFAAPIDEATYTKHDSKSIEKLEEASEMIELAKNQISLIVGSQGSNGLTTFNMPESLGKIHKKERMRKDLYSAALLGAWGVKEYLDIVDGGNQKTTTYCPVVLTS